MRPHKELPLPIRGEPFLKYLERVTEIRRPVVMDPDSPPKPKEGAER